METAYTKYQPTEILQIIHANYRQQQQYDDIALKDQEFTFDTTIADWQDICDLVDANELWKYLNYYFRLDLNYNWFNLRVAYGLSFGKKVPLNNEYKK